MSESNEPGKFFRKLLASMEAWGASDVYISVGKPPAARVAGRVIGAELGATSQAQFDEMLDMILSPAQRERYETEYDFDVGYSLDDDRRFRINLSRQRGDGAAVIRALPSGELNFEDLRLPETLKHFAEERRGLVLVTGATGSGKSTTLAAMIHHINKTRRAHIVTIEDPVEFVHADIRSRVSQREIGTDTKSFHAALKHVVRQSPDVILIGELRDRETMEVALTASLTGHLVLATLHTIDASQTLQRILSYFPAHLKEQAALDLALSLKAILSQRLVPTNDGAGRVVAVEILSATPPAKRLIRAREFDELYDLMRSTSDPGMQTFNEALLALYQNDEIDFDTGRAFATNAEEFGLAAQGMKTGVGTFRGDEDDSLDSGMDMKALLALCSKHGASDLHLTVGRPPILRIDGVLRPLKVKALTGADMRLLLYSVLSNHQRTTYELEREIDFAMALPNGQRFRINAYYQKGKMAASLRAIATHVPSAAKLGLPDVVLRLGEMPQGLLLVVGPTGSGKSTTLACLVDRINRSLPVRIVTVEDPIEFVHEGDVATIDQREVGADTKSFSAALKYVLRQDPDVILVGEMRDLDTIAAAITAAETGHLVLATLHTNDSAQAIDRIIDVFPAYQQPQIRAQLAASLLGVVSQRLLQRVGGGRVAAFEVLVATTAVRTMIREGRMHQVIGAMESSRADGMVTIDRSLNTLLHQGLITREEASLYVRNPRNLDMPPILPSGGAS